MYAIDDTALVKRFVGLTPHSDKLASEAVPVFVNCFNRVSVLRSLVDWLLNTEQRRLVLLDNASTYPPLLSYYHDLAIEPRVMVVQLGNNLGQNALWASGLLLRLGLTATPFIYTDPDILPDPGCPRDWLWHFVSILKQHPGMLKAGFGLRIDDLPSCYRFHAEVQEWEKQFWEIPIGEGQYNAPIDTTFALYRGGNWDTNAILAAKYRAVRTGQPYLARHLDWYIDSANQTEEQRYYQAHAIPGMTNWSGAELPANLKNDIAMVRKGLPMISQ